MQGSSVHQKMERFTVTSSSSSSSPSPGAFNSTILSPLENNNNPFPAPSFSSTKSHLQDPSLSPYVEKPVIESISTATVETASSRIIAGLGRRPNCMEISIFDADRYFNGNHEQGTLSTTIKKGSSIASANLEKIVENHDVFHNSKLPRNDNHVSGYLNGSTMHRFSSVSSSDGFAKNYRTGNFHATPTASSEASWNSQSGLLSNPPGSISVSMRNIALNEQKKVSSSSSKWSFGCKCPCSGKQSVEVTEPINPITPITTSCNSNGSSRITSPLNSKKIEKPCLSVKLEALEMADPLTKIAGNGRVTRSWETEPDKLRNSNRYSPEIRIQAELGRRIIPSAGPLDAGFSFPILNPKPGNLPKSPPEEPPRFSLEVFRPADETSQRKLTDLQLQRRLTSEKNNIRRSFAFPGSPKNRPGDDDVESDSSSDLFEIESFSTQTASYQMYRRRDSLDEISSFGGSDAVPAVRRNSAGILQFRRSLEEPVTPSEFYEPSEASVDWSVTTAEGFDRNSVNNFSTTASEYEDARFIKPESGKPGTGLVNGGGGLKRRGNGLLSCRCEKAVNVAPHPVNVGRKKATTKLDDVEIVHVPVMTGRPPLARSNSAHFPRPLTSRMKHWAGSEKKMVGAGPFTTTVNAGPIQPNTLL